MTFFGPDSPYTHCIFSLWAEGAKLLYNGGEPYAFFFFFLLFSEIFPSRKQISRFFVLDVLNFKVKLQVN